MSTLLDKDLVKCGGNIYEAIKRNAKTVDVKCLTNPCDDSQRLKNRYIDDMNLKLDPLTTDNADKASVVVSITNPEWGTKRFNYDPSQDGFHTVGSGCNSRLCFEGEFKFWAVVSYKI